MTPTFHWGNVLDTDCEVILHQVNMQGVMGSGVAKCIKKKYPEVYEVYAYECHRINSKEIFGRTLFVPVENNTKWIGNMFAQNEYGYDGAMYTSYSAFQSCLEDVKSLKPGTRIAIPWRIGCVRGGADWNKIKPLIEEMLKDYEIHYYCLNKWEA